MTSNAASLPRRTCSTRPSSERAARNRLDFATGIRPGRGSAPASMHPLSPESAHSQSSGRRRSSYCLLASPLTRQGTVGWPVILATRMGAVSTGEFEYEGFRLVYSEFGEGARPFVLLPGLLLPRSMHD